MPTKRKKDSKDFAAKQTLNPTTTKGRGLHTEEDDQLERKSERHVGQHTGEGQPSLIKK